jgi:hypothetical protein
MTIKPILSLSLLALLAGCNSYRVVQKNVFSDEDGNLVAIRYGIAEKDHVNTFVAPMTGKEMEFKSKLVILAELPDGDDFKAWQCMNFLSQGTMYQTDDEAWKVLLNGFSCQVFLRDEANPENYRLVYRGVICDSPDIGVKKDDRWKKVRPKPSLRNRKDSEKK